MEENVSEKHDEIAYFRSLLEGIEDLKDAVISADALQTQRGRADYIQSQEAHLVLTVNANQPSTSSPH